jgi:hypothetical protein
VTRQPRQPRAQKYDTKQSFALPPVSRRTGGDEVNGDINIAALETDAQMGGHVCCQIAAKNDQALSSLHRKGSLARVFVVAGTHLNL